MRNSQINILSAVDTGSATGGAIDVGQIISASFQVITGDADAAGTVKLQMSNDLTLGVPRTNFTPSNWSDIPNATSTVASGVAPPITIASMCYSYIRAIYTRSGGGSTTINVNMNVLSV